MFHFVKSRRSVLQLPRRFMHSVKSFVFWDLECSVPKKSDPFLVYNRISSALDKLGIQSPHFVRAYADFSSQRVTPVWLQKGLHMSGVHLIHSPDSDRNAILRDFERDIMIWVSQNPPPAHLLFITDDYNLAWVFQHLRRLKYNIMLACNNMKGNGQLTKAITLSWPWECLARGIPCIPWQYNEVSDKTLYPTMDRRSVRDKYDHEKTEEAAKETSRFSKRSKLEITCSTPREVTGDVAPAPTTYHIPHVISKVPKIEEHISYCRTIKEIESVLVEIKDRTKACDSQQVLVGLDAEWLPFRKGEKPSRVAVIQLCLETKRCYVLHVCHSGVPLALKALLENKSYLKVGFCIANDAKRIEADYDVKIYPFKDIVDLACAKFGKKAKNWGLAYLCEVVLHEKLEKPAAIRLGNWEVERLNAAQLQYAAADACASLHVYKALSVEPVLNQEGQDGSVLKSEAQDE